MARHLSILVAEPSLLLREKIACVLARDENVWCVTQVEGRKDLTRGVINIRPDFVFADLNILKDPETVAFIRRYSRRSSIYALVDSDTAPYADTVQRLGLDGVIEKGRVGESLTKMMTDPTDPTDETA